MAFKASCPFCPTELKVSRKLLGESVCCPECGNYFTAVPRDEVALPGAPSLRAVAVRPPVVSPPLSQTLKTNGTAVSRPSAVEPVRGEPAAPPEAVMASILEMPAWINGWGAVGFFLVGLALLCAAASSFRYLTIYFSGLAFFVVLLGFLVSAGARKLKDTIWLSISGIVGLSLVVVVLVRPSWLNSRWDMDVSVPAPDLNKQLLVSLDNRKVKKELGPSDWISAGEGSVRMGDLHIRVERVRVDYLPQKDPAAAKQKPKTLVSILIANAGHIRTVSYEGQGSRKHPPSLRDNKGQLLACSYEGKLDAQVTRTVLRPASHTEDLLVFDPAPKNAEYLELEIPASAWKSEGVCRFRIPRKMISWLATEPSP